MLGLFLGFGDKPVELHPGLGKAAQLDQKIPIMLPDGEMARLTIEVALHRIGRLFVFACFQIGRRKTQMVSMQGRIDRKALLVKTNGDIRISLGNRFLTRFPKLLGGRSCRHGKKEGHFLGKTKGRTPKTRTHNSQTQTGKPPTHVLAPKGESEAAGDAAMIHRWGYRRKYGGGNYPKKESAPWILVRNPGAFALGNCYRSGKIGN